jgi:hypothetical protein
MKKILKKNVSQEAPIKRGLNISPDLHTAIIYRFPP